MANVGEVGSSEYVRERRRPRQRFGALRAFCSHELTWPAGTTRAERNKKNNRRITMAIKAGVLSFTPLSLDAWPPRCLKLSPMIKAHGMSILATDASRVSHFLLFPIARWGNLP